MSSTALLEEDLTAAPPPAARSNPNSGPCATPRATQIVQVIVLAFLFTAPALRVIHSGTIGDNDIWWHLSTGNWILQHHAIPRVDLFSATVGGQPWQPYSWLFEVLTAKLFQYLGLAGIVTYTALLIVAITVALYHLIRRLQADFTISVLLTSVIGLIIGHLETPRPWLFTILFFVLEVDILMHHRKTGKLREFLWLPALFALWSNLHIQFINGLLVLGLALAASLAESLAASASPRWTAVRRPAFLWLGATLLASLIATFANPFGWHIYRVAYDLAAQPGVFNKISELQAVPFRAPSDFLLLFFALASTAALARSKRIPLFETGLLLFAVYLSFRSQRDVWIMAVAAAAILAAAIPSQRDATSATPSTNNNPTQPPAFAVPAALLLTLIASLLGFRAMHINNTRLAGFQSRDLPVKAVDFVQQHHLSGPLFNDYGWGSYLIWSLKIPVSIDGRAALYGDPRIDRSVSTWSGEPDWHSDSQLTHANLVIGPLKSPLTQLLRLDPHFQLVYEDKQAAVFIARR